MFFTAEWAQTTSVERDRALPFLVLPERRLPALSLLPGQSPAQEDMQYGDVKPATEADVSGKLENLQSQAGGRASQTGINSTSAMRVLLADVAVNQQPDFF